MGSVEVGSNTPSCGIVDIAFRPAPRTTFSKPVAKSTGGKAHLQSLSGHRSPHQKLTGITRSLTVKPLPTKMSTDQSAKQVGDDGTGHRWLLLRHGQTNHNAEGRIQGSTDLSRLTELGEEQAKKVGEFVAQLEIDRVYVSPLTRAQQTLKLVESVGKPLGEATVVPDLREIDLHEWEGMLKADIKEKYPEFYQQWRGDNPKEFKLASGKFPIRDLFERAKGVWTGLLEEAHAGLQEEEALQGGVTKGRVQTLVTGHNGINQAMLCAAAGMDEDCFRKYEFPNCGICEIVWNPGEARARRWRWLYPEKSPWNEVGNGDGCISDEPERGARDDVREAVAPRDRKSVV